MGKKSILVIEDDIDIRELISFNLEKEGYRVLSAEDGETGLKMAVDEHIDLVILDLMLPGMDGYEICRELKKTASTEQLPIIMLTAKSEDSDIVIGLEMGADDYMVKPFTPRVLLARIKAVLRRGGKSKVSGDIIRIHNLVIDPAKHEVHMNGSAIELSVTEFTILAFLAKNPGWVFSRSQIINSVKGSDYPVTERSVDVQILGLRKKLKESGNLLETVRGVGYRMKESG
jgi:two-component system alkaline phosphatase synthesis response regulator PhoP